MLIDFSVTNHKSFKNEARFSLVAARGAEHRESNVVIPSLAAEVQPIPLLRSAAIYGANAAGKTNLLTALDLMKRIIQRSGPGPDEIPVSPFRFDPSCDSEPTSFEATFIADGIRYQYGFSATLQKIVGEYLYAWPRGRVQTWFERNAGDEDNIKFGDRLSGDREVWRRATRPDALLLSTAVNLNSRQLRPVYDWFSDRLRVAGIGGWNPEFSLQCCRDDRKDRIVRFLQASDLAISDLRVVETGEVNDGTPPQVGLNRSKIRGKLRLLHKVPETVVERELDMAEESFGTQKIFALSGPWLDTLENGNVVAFDELHGNLHPVLMRFLVDCFHNPQLNANGAQLIFTTHETAILSQDVFRRDQVWFCERNERQETALYPLTDFRPRKRVENLERAYLSGRYGGVPLIDPHDLIQSELQTAP